MGMKTWEFGLLGNQPGGSAAASVHTSRRPAAWALEIMPEVGITTIENICETELQHYSVFPGIFKVLI